eukprot:m.81304 g.81304  ORF g.81304 m.81304 type:complete len:67 (-) comp19450_c0_seq2:67-267(-)
MNSCSCTPPPIISPYMHHGGVQCNVQSTDYSVHCTALCTLDVSLCKALWSNTRAKATLNHAPLIST